MSATAIGRVMARSPWFATDPWADLRFALTPNTRPSPPEGRGMGLRIPGEGRAYSRIAISPKSPRLPRTTRTSTAAYSQ